MNRLLLIDIGAGTMDLLYYDRSTRRHYKAVAVSPVRYLAWQIKRQPGDLLLTGVEMGGGAIGEVLKARAALNRVMISESAAMTLHHDPKRVASWGIRVIDDRKAHALKQEQRYRHIELSDLDMSRIRHILAGLGIPLAFDIVGLCAQDHGNPPAGMSHLDYRHHLFSAALEKAPAAQTLLYPADRIPETLSRLRAIAKSAAQLPAKEIYVMDSGIAAILGASMDAGVRHMDCMAVLDVATSHTLGAALLQGEIAAFFEYHTRDISAERITSLVREMADGRLQHERILQEGGHGAYTRKAVGFERLQAIVATGPKRALIEGSALKMTAGAPLGDNMMTGTVGLLAAIGRYKQWPSVQG